MFQLGQNKWQGGKLLTLLLQAVLRAILAVNAMAPGKTQVEGSLLSKCVSVLPYMILHSVHSVYDTA